MDNYKNMYTTDYLTDDGWYSIADLVGRPLDEGHESYDAYLNNEENAIAQAKRITAQTPFVFVRVVSPKGPTRYFFMGNELAKKENE